MKIEVVKHSRKWREMYIEEAEKIKDALGDELVAIFHIGSTSIKNLAAKPIIDIMPVVNDVQSVDAHNKEFEGLGYECMGEYGIPLRRFFRKGGENRTHHIHVFGIKSADDIIRHLAFRDYLSAHPSVAEAYGKIKSDLAIRFPYDIDGYCDGKNDFVKSVEKDALVWYEQNGYKPF